MGDSYFFINEIVKVQGTSPEEATLYNSYVQEKRLSDRRWGRAAATCVFAPYFWQCFIRRGIAWKIAVFYGLLICTDAVYDVGLYTSFLVNGPGFMRKLMRQDESTSFGSI